MISSIFNWTRSSVYVVFSFLFSHLIISKLSAYSPLIESWYDPHSGPLIFLKFVLSFFYLFFIRRNTFLKEIYLLFLSPLLSLLEHILYEIGSLSLFLYYLLTKKLVVPIKTILFLFITIINSFMAIFFKVHLTFLLKKRIFLFSILCRTGYFLSLSIASVTTFVFHTWIAYLYRFALAICSSW